MASSFTGGISAPFNVLLNRELNLYNATDPVACRQNIGAVAIGDLKTLTYGYGLATGTFNPDADGTISVDASATGTAGKVVKTDNNGDLTATNKLNLGGGLSFLNREAGANGTLQMRNTGTGILKLDSAGTLQLSADSTAYLQSYEAVSIGSYDGTTIQLTAADGTTARTALSVSGTGGYSGSKGLSVVGGTALDALDVSGAATFSSTIRSPLQPSWNWYKSTASTTNTIGLSPF